MARSRRPKRNTKARSFRQLRRFHHVINPDSVFGTHRPYNFPRTALLWSNRHEVWAERRRPSVNPRTPRGWHWTGYGALMDTALNPKQADPRHVLVARAV